MRLHRNLPQREFVSVLRLWKIIRPLDRVDERGRLSSLTRSTANHTTATLATIAATEVLMVSANGAQSHADIHKKNGHAQGDDYREVLHNHVHRTEDLMQFDITITRKSDNQDEQWQDRHNLKSDNRDHGLAQDLSNYEPRYENPTAPSLTTNVTSLGHPPAATARAAGPVNWCQIALETLLMNLCQIDSSTVIAQHVPQKETQQRTSEKLRECFGNVHLR